MGKMRKLLNLKFTVNPIRDDKYIISKLKIFKKINRKKSLYLHSCNRY